MAADRRTRVELLERIAELEEIVRRLRKKLKGGVVPPQAQHVVTVYPTAVAPSPSIETGITNPTNVFADDGSVMTITPNESGGDDEPTVHYGFDLEEILPSDAVIDQVEVEVENRHDGTAGAAARPQINPRVNDEPGTWVGRTDMTNVLTPFSNDITAQAVTNQAVWGTPTDEWTREMLIDSNFLLGVRSRNVGDIVGLHEWDYVRMKVTYTGSPPETPAQVRHALNVGTVGDGEGLVTGPGLDTSEGEVTIQVPAGTVMPLVGTPEGTSFLEGWEGTVPEGHELDNPLTIVMDEAKSVDARFTGTPPGDPVESHWGDIIAEDLGDGHPIDHWHETSTPWYSAQVPQHSGDPRQDPYVQRVAETGLWIPHRRASPSTHFRRFICPPAYPQSLYDRYITPSEAYAINPEGASTRCQAQRWSSSRAFWIGRAGDRVWIVFGWRIPEDNPLTKPANGSGALGYAQIVQWKVRASGYSEVDAVVAGSDGVQFEFSDHPGNVEDRDVVKCPHGVWHRAAIEMLLSPDDEIGYVTNWVKLHGTSAWTQVGPKRFKGTVVPNNGYRNMGIGPYYRIEATTDNQEHSTDIRDTQIIEYV